MIRYESTSDGYLFVVRAVLETPPNRMDPEIGIAESRLNNILPDEDLVDVCFTGQYKCIHVEPGYRNKGIGRRLLQLTGELVRDTFGVSKVRAFTVASSQSLPFYVKNFNGRVLPNFGHYGDGRMVAFDL